MATSKHFPVQNYSPRSDSDDYSFNETPYNSVSSFKSYHSNRNRNNSVPTLVSNNFSLEVKDYATQAIREPFVKNVSQTKKKNELNVSNKSQDLYIDNTVVSGYGRTKPPIPVQKEIHKPKLPKAPPSRYSVIPNNLKQVNSEQDHKKFGIEHLQTLTKQLQSENKEHRRLRNPKEVLIGSEGGPVDEGNRLQVESVNDSLELSLRESGTPSPDSRGAHENGRHSSMSRRKLPKTPPEMHQPNKSDVIPNVTTGSSATYVAVTVDSDSKFGAEVKGNRTERRHSLQWDDDIVTGKSNKPEDKVTGEEVHGNNSSESARSRLARRLGKHRQRDKKRSQSLGDQTEAQTAVDMMTNKRLESESVMDGFDMERTQYVTNASEESADLELSSQQDSESIFNYSPEQNPGYEQAGISKLSVINTSAIDFDGDLCRHESRPVHRRSISETSQECVENVNKHTDSTHISSYHSSNEKCKDNAIDLFHKHLEIKDLADEVNDDNQVDQNEEEYSVVTALNDIVDSATSGLSDKLPGNVFFTFDHTVIQELTDSVMGTGEFVVSTNSEIIETDHDENDLNRALSKEEKRAIEGKTFYAKSPDEYEKFNTRKNSDETSISGKTAPALPEETSMTDKNVEKEAKIQKTKVERSPSYRKKVMARAKNRYKKSSMLKDCSCTRNENGDIVVCNFCENYENKKRRSRSSLGLDTAGLGKDICDLSEGESSDISSYSEISGSRRAFSPSLPPLPSSKSPRPLRKLQVSSRVDVLMSSDLFKKHLYKHENILQRHTMFRRAGMRKSVSNLDLSEGYVIDSDSQCETESVTSEVNLENDTSASKDIVAHSNDSSKSKTGARRHSLTDDSDVPTESSNKEKKKHFRTLPTSVGRVRPPIPSFADPKARPNIPTFKEYKFMKELSKSTEALNVSEDQKDMSIKSATDKVDIVAKKEDSKVVENEREVVELTRNIESLPLQLQVIKESHSKENLIDISNTISENSLEGDSMNLKGNYVQNTDKELSQNEKVLVSLWDQNLDNHSNQTVKSDKTADKSSRDSTAERQRDKLTGHEQLSRQQSAPNFKLHQQRPKPKLKSRTLSRLDLEPECSSDTAPGLGTAAVRERRKPGTKRPRSLISKKSSLMSLIQESDNKAQNSEDGDSNSEKSISSRRKLKVGHNVNRSKSDSKYEMGKVKDMLPEGENRNEKQLRALASFERGRNTVSFDLDDTSRCSPFDIGESETSTSIAESLSDSLRSEVNIEECDNQAPNDHDDPEKHLHDPDDTFADDNSIGKPVKEELTSQVLRSTSDAGEITQEAARKRRERKERPYKSDPFSGTEILPASKRCIIREEKAKLKKHLDFANSSKEEILTFLDGVSHGDIVECNSYPSLEELNEDDEQLQLLSRTDFKTSRKVSKHLSNVSSLSTDSGVIGQDGSHDSQQSSPTNTLSHSQSEQAMSSSWQHTDAARSLSASCAELGKKVQECGECGPADMLAVHRSLVCSQCLDNRRQRKEIIQEIIDTEMNYGRDLNILKEEFYKPIMKALLLNKDQLDAIFLNLDELIHVNKHFITKLKSAIHAAVQSGDNELKDVMIGCLFLESSTMFLTFENYCVNQAQAPVLLEQLEREKELLRIFLQVSQNDNHQLRRMHLKSFLMVPVQRIMKYPLLLDRLHKTTPAKHLDKSSLKEAKDKIEDILGHINAKSRTVSFRQRKPSQKSAHHCSVTEKIEVSRVALETLQWNRKDVCDVITSQLHVTQPVDHLWAAKKCKNYKFSTVYGVLMTLMQQPTDSTNDNEINIIKNSNYHGNNENNNSRVKSAAVVFIKEKNGRYQVMRDPFMLEKCVVSQDPEYTEVFEILEWSKEAFLIKAETPQETKLWVQNLRQQMNNLGFWRKRRNALPNILLNHLS